ncbi:MAG: AraC family transcriptional regulator ligand-binding domain-containing protein [Pseudomonadota bacterium]
MVNLIELAHVVDVLDSIGARSVATKALGAADLNRDMLLSGEGYIPYASMAVMLEAAARALGERHLGVHIGRRFDYNIYGGYSDYVLSAPYLGAALARARRALPLIHPGSDLSLRVEGRNVTIAFSTSVASVLGYRHITEGSLFVIAQAFHHFLGPSWHPLWLEISVEDDGARSLLEEFMQSPLRVGAPHTALVFDKADLRARNPHENDLSRVSTFQEVVAGMSPPIPLTTADALLHLFRLRRAGADFTQDSAAEHLMVGTRTLQRDLRSENTSFREVKARHLTERARALLAESDLSVDAVARSLGYSEPNSFRRAFQKSTGLSPRDFRLMTAVL